MAILLFKYVRGKYRGREAATAATNHLVPEVDIGKGEQELQKSAIRGSSNGVNDQADVTHIPSHVSPSTAQSTEEDAQIRAEASRRTKRRWKLVAGLMLPNFLAAIDVTIVAPAAPIISSHFSTSSSRLSRYPLANLQRPAQWEFQLDSSRIHSDLYYVCPGVRPDRRYLWPSRRSPVPNFLDFDW